MKPIVVNTFSELHGELEPYLANPLAIFRGQGNSEWPLVPMAGRKPYNKIEDCALFSDWKKQARQYIKEEPKSFLEWLALARHYGLATRLLDWSRNPLVAAFFAVWEEEDADAAIYCFCGEGPCVDSVYVDFPHKPNPNVFEWRPDAFSERICRQQATFTVHDPPTQPLYFLEDFESLKQIIVPKRYRLRLRKELAFYGYTRSLLFPDLDGLSMHMNWKIFNESDFSAHQG